MRPVVLVCAVCLISVSAFAQRGGHAGGGSHASSGSFHGGSGSFHGSGGVSHASGSSRGSTGARGGSWSGGGNRRGGVSGHRNFGYGRSRYWYPYYGLGWDYGLGWGAYGYGWGPYYAGLGDYASSYDSSSYYSQPYSQGAYYEPQPPVIVNQSLPYPEPPPPPQPEVREYTNPSPEHTDYSPVLYLIALKNNNILAALTYWAEKGELHYVNLEHQTKQVPLNSIDRELTDRLNRERNITVRLPG